MFTDRFSSVQFSHSVVSLRPHESQHARPPCPSPTPGVHPNSCPSSRWCHPAISSSVVPFSSCPQSLPGSESFPMSQLFPWGGQSTGVSALASFLPKKEWSVLLFVDSLTVIIFVVYFLFSVFLLSSKSYVVSFIVTFLPWVLLSLLWTRFRNAISHWFCGELFTNFTCLV